MAAGAVCGLVLALTFAARAGEPESGCEAKVFVQESLEENPSVFSPDGRYRVVVSGKEDDENGLLQVYRNKVEIGRFKLHNLSGGIFLKWAPDSKAFYLMWSNGGMIGAYEVRVFRATDESAQELPSAKQAEHDFRAHHNCAARGINVFAIQWMGRDSNQILLATQKYPTGDCGQDAGLFGGYLVRSADGEILKSYSEKQIKGIWPKGCPTRIWPTGLWGEEQLHQANEDLKKKSH